MKTIFVNIIKNRSVIFNITMFLICVVYLWAGCYTFYLFPWEPQIIKWWYIPHLATFFGIGGIIVYIATKIEEKIQKEETSNVH